MTTGCTDCVYTHLRSEHSVSQTTSTHWISLLILNTKPSQLGFNLSFSSSGSLAQMQTVMQRLMDGDSIAARGVRSVKPHILCVWVLCCS